MRRLPNNPWPRWAQYFRFPSPPAPPPGPQVLNDVFANLSPALQADVATEEPAAAFRRMSEFLINVLNYKPPPNRMQVVGRGRPGVLCESHATNGAAI